MKDRALLAIPLVMGLILLLLGCVTDPPLVLQPSELCSDHGNSAIATFEDPNLERAVTEQPGVGARNDLTCGLVSGFEGVDFAGYGVTSLVGIQNLRNLESLYLFNNSISDISPLSGLTSLSTLLDLSNNTSLANIQPLLDNPGLGPIAPGLFYRDSVNLSATNVSCTDVAALVAKNVIVFSDCP